MIQGTGRISPPLVGPGVAQLCELRMAHEVPERRVPAPSLLCAPHSQPEQPRATPAPPRNTHTPGRRASHPGSQAPAPRLPALGAIFSFHALGHGQSYCLRKLSVCLSPGLPPFLPPSSASSPPAPSVLPSTLHFYTGWLTDSCSPRPPATIRWMSKQALGTSLEVQ